MRYILLLFSAVALLCAQSSVEHDRLAYPPAPKGNQTDDYHGTTVADPYRWLEDADSPATVKWVEAENTLTFSYLNQLPGREAIRAQLTQLWDYERYGGITSKDWFREGGHYFFFRNSGLQNQSVLYVAESLNAPERVLLDPNTYRADGTAALSDISVSRDGKLLAYALAQAGSDWSEWRVRDVASGKDRPDLLQWTKFTNAEWLADSSGFYYARYPEPATGKTLTAANTDSKLYFHKLGTAQSEDRLIYERPDHPDWRFAPALSDDGRYLVIYVTAVDAAKNLLFYQDLQAAQPKTVELITKFEHSYDFAGNVGTEFYLLTSDGAPRRRIVTVDVSQPARSQWKEIIPEGADTLSDVRIAAGKLVLSYLKDAHATARVTTMEGKATGELRLPGIGMTHWETARQQDEELFYKYTSFLAPPAIYRYDVKTGVSSLVRSSKLKYDPSDFETKQVFCASKDGTRVPMFLSSYRGVKLTGEIPVLLTAYGGFSIPITPDFAPRYIEWMKLGGIVAVANLRGGSEYGEAWHEAGMRQRKQNVFDDFIAAAEWLIAHHYTSSAKLAIAGRSNGGLLMGAVLNQRPDLFGAAVAGAGVLDMLRFQKFTVGQGWTGEYGSADNAEDFKWLRAYSPLHNIRNGASYPPVLITTADHDDRVVPGHSFKYAAALQAAQSGKAPILIRIETRGGHGAGLPTSKQIEETTDFLAFLAGALDMQTCMATHTVGCPGISVEAPH